MCLKLTNLSVQLPDLRQILSAAVALILGIVFLAAIPRLDTRWWLFAPLVFVFLLAYHHRDVLPVEGRAAFMGFMLAVIIIRAYEYGMVVSRNVQDPPDWDIGLFWLYGRVASQGLNVYDPSHAIELMREIGFSSDAINEAYFWYPPPTMLMVAPLGWFDMHIASLLWHTAHVLFLVICIFLLWRIFLKDSGLLGLGFASALILMLHSSYLTFIYGQTHFLLLLMLLLFWRNHRFPRGSLWLAIGIFVKPVLAVLGLYLVVRRHWLLIAWLLVAMIAICVLTIVVFGADTFLSYFSANPIGNLPAHFYVAGWNESLLTAVVLLANFNVEESSPYTMPAFLLLAFILIAITIWLIYRVEDYELILALVVLLGLMLYPLTQQQYGVLLIIPVLVIWKNRNRYFTHYWVPAILIAFTYALAQIQQGYVTFIAFLLNWGALALISGELDFVRKQQRSDTHSEVAS